MASQNKIYFDPLSVIFNTTGLSGAPTSPDLISTSAPWYSILNRWIILAINTYSSSLANLWPMQDLNNLVSLKIVELGHYLGPWLKGILENALAWCWSEWPLSHLSGRNSSGLEKLSSLLLELWTKTLVPDGIWYPPRTISTWGRSRDLICQISYTEIII